MKAAIKAIHYRIGLLNDRIKEAEKRTEEPEMLCDYVEILELQEAIKILNNA